MYVHNSPLSLKAAKMPLKQHTCTMVTSTTSSHIATSPFSSMPAITVKRFSSDSAQLLLYMTCTPSANVMNWYTRSIKLSLKILISTIISCLCLHAGLTDEQTRKWHLVLTLVMQGYKKLLLNGRADLVVTQPTCTYSG